MPPGTDIHAIVEKALIGIVESPSSEDMTRIRACELLLSMAGIVNGAAR